MSAAVAPGVKLIGLDVFDGAGNSRYTQIASAVDWVIANKDVYNVTVINLSLGAESTSTGMLCPQQLCLVTMRRLLTVARFVLPANTRVPPNSLTSCSPACLLLVLVLPPACDTNALAASVNTAYDFGIMTTAAAGNEGKKTAVLVPACATRAVAVGAVYSTTAPSVGFSVCSDTDIVPDKVCCFSNRCAQQHLQAAAWTCCEAKPGHAAHTRPTQALCQHAASLQQPLPPARCKQAAPQSPRLELWCCCCCSSPKVALLAPGHALEAAGITLSGTSQASPVVAGAIAVVRGRYPSYSLEQVLNLLRSTGTPVSRKH